MKFKGISLRCPDCHSAITEDSFKCGNCTWSGDFSDGIYNLLPSTLEKEKINEDLIHTSVNEPIWKDLIYKKKIYFDKFENLWKDMILKTSKGSFLEIAGGLCYISALVKHYNPDSTVWASDVSPLYLKSKSKTVSSIMNVNVDFYSAMDAENLPFDDAQFDSIFISHSIHHLGNIEKMLQEAWRVLSPGGRFLGIDIAAPILKSRYKRDVLERAERALEFGINEKTLSYMEWSEIIKQSGIPNVKLTYEPGPKTKSQRVRRLQNLTRRIPIWISMIKPE